MAGKTITDELRDLDQFVEASIKKLETEEREPTAEERTAVDEALAKMKSLSSKRDAQGLYAGWRTSASGFQPSNGNGNGKPVTATSARTLPYGGMLPLIQPGAPSLGAAFVEADAMRAILGQPRSGQWTSPTIEIDAAVSVTPVGPIPPGVIVIPPPPVWPYPLISTRFGQGTTDAGSIPYLYESSFTNAADYVTMGAAKPASDKVFTLASAPLLKIAHHIKCPDELLDDIPALRSFIDQNLSGGLVKKLEAEVVSGTGAAGRIMGLIPLPGKTTAIAYTTPPAVMIASIAAMYSAIWTAAGRRPDTVAISPNTHQLITMQVNSQGAPYFPNPFEPNDRPLYGMTAVISPVIPDGTAIVGAFSEGSMLFRKGGISIQATNSDQDDFIKNITTIRAEMRVALVHWVPAAYGLVTGIDLTP